VNENNINKRWWKLMRGSLGKNERSISSNKKLRSKGIIFLSKNGGQRAKRPQLFKCSGSLLLSFPNFLNK